MSRDVNDPRIVEILAAFDRAASSPEAPRNANMLDLFMVSVVGTGHDRFMVPARWSADALRALLLAFLVNAPDDDLDDMLSNARDEIKSLGEFEVVAAFERATGKPYSHEEARALLKAEVH